MSSINFRILIFALFFSFFCYSQKNLPNLILIKADGSEVNLNKLSNESIIILNFWATWCVPCINELNAYN
ncbi:MAG: redoxin domain-containing protein, partial [Flavobacteriaceae bacterium]|nr:redoxin domain-containing protein [Flavobacteriaceae bacterium]